MSAGHYQPINAIYEETGEEFDLSDGDISHGRYLFEKHCQFCHSLVAHGHDGIGPNLLGVIDRRIASQPGFHYSVAMKEFSDETWTFQNLFTFLGHPRQFMPGNRMGFTGLQRVKDRLDLLAYMNNVTGTEMDEFTLETKYRLHEGPYGAKPPTDDYRKHS